jgi:cathepsin L
MLVLSLSSYAFGADVRYEWKDFTAKFGKTYDASEYARRFAIFEANHKFVQEHNALGHSYKVGINQFADLTNEEFVRMYTGYNGQAVRERREAVLDVAEIPQKVDWSAKGAVTPIKNQGQCGSCWSFSATGSMEGAHFLAGNKLVGLSEQNLVDCSTTQGNMGCNGGLMDDAFKYVIANNGIDSEESYPYTATGPNQCEFKPENVVANISSYADIPKGNETALQAAVAAVGPVSVAIDASHYSFQLYTSGVYWSEIASSTNLDHGVLVVGHDLTKTTLSDKAYKVKNSWGASWGMDGYIWMIADWDNNCGIATAASYPIV